MLQHLVFIVFLLATSLAAALLEIEIEGEEGWGAGLPTWRANNEWTRMVLGERPLTGFHLWAFVTVLFLAHLPYALAFVFPGWWAELRILGFLALFWVLENFFWYVANPTYGMPRFSGEGAWWNRPTLAGVLPRDYGILLPLGLLFYILSWI